MKKKILILINSDLYTRNYLETDALRKIIKNYNCTFVVCSNDVHDKKKINKLLSQQRVIYVNYLKTEMDNFQKYLYKNSLINKENSKTVSYFTKKNLQPVFYWPGESFLALIFMLPARFLSWLKKNIENIFLKIFKKNTFIKKINVDVLKICKTIQPHLVLFPLQDPHLMSYEFLQVKSKYKTIGIIDNWDNISSRPTYDLKPDFITVWGEQTKEQAIKFQKYNKKNIFVIGTPRFDRYFLERNKNLKSHFKFKYFLFLESFNNYKNFSLIKKIDNLILTNKNFFGYKILYRPHPWQKKNTEILNEMHFKNLVIDPQLKENYYLRNFSPSFQPDISYYSSLIQNATLVIAGPTSMVIEASIFYKKILVLGYKSNSQTPYSEELKNFEHLKGLKNFPNIKILTDESRFQKELIDTLQIKINKAKTDRIRNFYLNYSGKKYNDRLYLITKFIMNDEISAKKKNKRCQNLL
jgi:hypothetical protein